VAIIWLGYYASSVPGGTFTTDLIKLYKIAPDIPMRIQTWMFLAFALSFCIKVPLFPFHTWLPDAHVQAPTAGSVILAGVLLKMGTYGLVRFCLPLFPFATFTFMPYIATLAVIGIVYGALVSMVQVDLKKLVAYSSVSHLGFVVLGIFALNEEGMQGSVIQMINHGLSTGALFLLVGMIYDRRHTRLIKDFGGLAKQMPVYAAFFMIVMLSSVGLPGLNGFVGEFLILLGAFKSQLLGTPLYAIIGATGVIFAAVYLLWSYQRVFFGKLENPANEKLMDLSAREIAVLVPVLVFIVWIGFYPATFLDKSAASSKHVIQQIENARLGVRSSVTLNGVGSAGQK
jgi:NADH-quinone oxidoreductase subunit M